VASNSTEFKQDKIQPIYGSQTDRTRQANLSAPDAGSASGFIMTSINVDTLDRIFNPSYMIAEAHYDSDEEYGDLREASTPLSDYENDKDEGKEVAQQSKSGAQYEQDHALIAIQLSATAPGYPWVLDTGASEHICSDETAFSTMQAYTTGQEYEWWTSGNEKVKADAHGIVNLTLHLGDEIVHAAQEAAIRTIPACYQISIHCVYKKGGQYNLFSLGTAEKQLGIWWNSKTGALHDEYDKLIGYTRMYQRVPFLQLVSPALGAALISIELAHRRLGHTSSHTTKINQADLGCDVH
jgi:hypothetical protein